MRKMLLLFVILLPLGVFAQSSADKKYEKELYQLANNYMYEENFEQAQNTYKSLLEIVPNNDQYLFETGLSYFFAPKNQGEAIKYLEKALAVSRPDTLPELFYYLGRTYQLNSKFELAIMYYEKFLPMLKDNKSGRAMKEEINQYIKMCQHGMYHLNLFTANPVENADAPRKDLTKYYINDSDYIAVENFGATINSFYAEYTPILINNENVLVYTSRRDKFGQENQPLLDGQFYENVYFSRFAEGEWKQPVEIGFSNIFSQSITNIDGHNAAVYMSLDETMLLLYQQNAIYYSQRTGSKWSTPEKLPETINEPNALISSAAISPDKQIMLVVAEKKGGFGGRDIYKSVKDASGNWSKLENIGAVINTEKDEESPYFHLDSKTLYFSSKGHSSIGGYDVFKSTLKEDGTWDTPKSLGVPINTPADEIYYSLSNNGKTAYYASSRQGGYGDVDLYRIYKGKDKRITPLATAEPPKEKETITEEPKEIAIAETPKTDEKPDEVALVDHNEEADKVEQPKPVTQPKDSTKPEAQSSTAKTITTNVPENLVANLSFDFNSNGLSEANQQQITQLVEFLKQNPNTTITINGHADYLGSNEVNMKVSKQRALMVFNQMIKNGADPLQVNIDFFGEEKPIVNAQKPDGTDIPENRAINRRVELEVTQYHLFRYVLFGFDSYLLTAESKNTLDKVAEEVKNFADKTIELNGYTDKIGNVDYNKYLSSKRVDAAYNYLIAKGVDKTRIQKNAFGVDNQTVPEGAAASQKFNRRVEIIIKK